MILNRRQFLQALAVTTLPLSASQPESRPSFLHRDTVPVVAVEGPLSALYLDDVVDWHSAAVFGRSGSGGTPSEIVLGFIGASPVPDSATELRYRIVMSDFAVIPAQALLIDAT